MDPSQSRSLVGRCPVRNMLVGALLALGVLEPATVASVPSPVIPVVALTNDVLRWRLPESGEFGWIIQQSPDLLQWESLGDPATVLPRRHPVVELPYLQAQRASFFRTLPGSDSAREALLHEQWSRWRAAGLRTYEFEFRWTCFCVPDFTQWVRITVADDAIVAVRRAADGGELAPDLWPRYHTLDGLAAWLAKAFEQDAARIEVSYDAGFGYPLSGYVDFHELMADEEMGFEVRFPQPPAALLLTEAPASWPGDPYVIEAVRREGDWLQVDVAFSGGCVDPHGWALTAVPGSVRPGVPREVLLYLTHDARGDSCEAYIHKRLTFGLSSLRAWWARENPDPDGESPHLLLGVLNPQSKPPGARAVLDYTWNQATFVPWRDVVTATAQQWHGGVFGSGNGTDYQMILRFPSAWGDAVQVRTLWIMDRAFTPEVTWSVLPSGGGRVATLRAAFRAIPRLDPDHPGQILGVDESPPRDPQAPRYAGAALLVTEALGQTQEWAIPILHELPAVFYP